MSELPKQIRIVRLEIQPPPGPMASVRPLSGGAPSDELLAWQATIAEHVREAGSPQLVGPCRLDVAIDRSVVGPRKWTAHRTGEHSSIKKIVRALVMSRVIGCASQVQVICVEWMDDVVHGDAMRHPVLAVISEISTDQFGPEPEKPF